MEFKGTPGPWLHADSHGLNETAGGAIHGDGKTLCLVLGKGIGKGKSDCQCETDGSSTGLAVFAAKITRRIQIHTLTA